MSFSSASNQPAAATGLGRALWPRTAPVIGVQVGFGAGGKVGGDVAGESWTAAFPLRRPNHAEDVIQRYLVRPSLRQTF